MFDPVEYPQPKPSQRRIDELEAELSKSKRELQVLGDTIESISVFCKAGKPDFAADETLKCIDQVEWLKGRSDIRTDTELLIDTISELQEATEELEAARETINQMGTEIARLKNACEEFRDTILHQRHQMAENGMDSDQVNDVLSVYDDTIGAVLAEQPDPEDETEGDPIGWTIVAIGKDGSVLCDGPGGTRRRYWFGATIDEADFFEPVRMRQEQRAEPVGIPRKP